MNGLQNAHVISMREVLVFLDGIIEMHMRNQLHLHARVLSVYRAELEERMGNDTGYTRTTDEIVLNMMHFASSWIAKRSDFTGDVIIDTAARFMMTKDVSDVVYGTFCQFIALLPNCAGMLRMHYFIERSSRVEFISTAVKEEAKRDIAKIMAMR
mgnify:CR=1 FL=1